MELLYWSFIYALKYTFTVGHLSWKLKWAIVIALCPSGIVFSHLQLLIQNHLTYFDKTL